MRHIGSVPDVKSPQFRIDRRPMRSNTFVGVITHDSDFGEYFVGHWLRVREE